MLYTQDIIYPTVYAKQDIINGEVIGTLNDKPVIKASVIDMGSKDFQQLVDSIVGKEQLTTIRYVADTIQWNQQTQVIANGVGNIKDTLSLAQTQFLKRDGFLDNDKGKMANVGDTLYVTDVGTVTDLKTNDKIPVHLAITYNGVTHGADGVTNDQSVGMAIKNQAGVITIGFTTLAMPGAINSGGQTEGGHVGTGGAIISGRLAGYIDAVQYTATLVRADIGEAIPDDEMIMAMKMSDVDAMQRASLGKTGVFGYIVSPDTKLAVQGGGLVSTTSEAFNADTTQLSANSYIILKQRNSARVDYQYTDGARNHLTIVTGLFGNTGFTINTDKTGTIVVNKSGQLSVKKMWNNLYSLEGNVFKVTNQDTKESFTLTTDKTGSATKSEIPFGRYMVEEVSASKGFKKTFVPQEVTLTIDTPKVSVGGKDDQVVTATGTNEEYTGEILIDKSGVESDKMLWNHYYSLAGNRFTLEHQQTKQVIELVTDDKGRAQKTTLPLGTYTILETHASNGFIKTFAPQTATLTQDGLLVFTASGTNQEIKGQNKLIKFDKETGHKAQGKATLKTAQYALYYGEDNGQAKKDAAVKWTDVPHPTLLTGEKVTESVINGTLVQHGDNIVLDVDDQTLEIGVGNLRAGIYYWKEINAPEGYSIDGTRHEFIIDKVDDATATIVTPTKESKESVIKAMISLQKLVQASSDLTASGYNDIQFTLTPLANTTADVKTITTGIKQDEDGHASVVLEYGDWILTETNAPTGYKPIQPIYIHMNTDEQTDLVTITASHHEDGHDPFSKRTFSQSDNQLEANQQATGSLAGTISANQPMISLSRLTIKNNEVTPDDDSFQPEKYVLNQGDFDLMGTLLLDDDRELTDKYADTQINPYSDQVDNNETANINTKTLKRGQSLTYQLWLDTTHFEDDDVIQELGMMDTIDKGFISTGIDQVKVYDKQTGQDVTNAFHVSIQDQTMKIMVNEKGKENGRVTLPFGRYYVIVLEGTVSQNVESGVDIVNSAEQFVQFGDRTVNGSSNQEKKPTQKRVNKVADPTIQPHKFTLIKPGIDLTGQRLLDDDSELADRYSDTAKNPYIDTVQNNESENLNTKFVTLGQSLTYQLWLDTTEFTNTMLLRELGMIDDFDETHLMTQQAKLMIHDSITGQDVTQFFHVEIKDGQLFVSVNDTVYKTITIDGKANRVIDTEKLPFGRYYKIEFTVTVSDDVQPGIDIKNVAKQYVIDHNNKRIEQTTETRVNPVKQATNPLLPSTGDTQLVWWSKLVGWLLFISSIGYFVRKKVMKK